MSSPAPPADWADYHPAANELAGRVVAITGANRGLGRAVAMAAAAHGAEVVLIGRNPGQLEQVHAEIVAAGGPEPVIAPLDLEQALARDYDALAAALLQRYRRLDGLVHNAAELGQLAPIEHYDVPTWCRVLQVNLTAAFALTQVLLPALRASGDASILFTSSAVGRRGAAYWGAYAATKFALEGLMQVLAEELRGISSVRVNSLNPGPTRSRLRRAAFPSEDWQQVPPPEARVKPYLWLLGAASRGCTGLALVS